MSFKKSLSSFFQWLDTKPYIQSKDVTTMLQEKHSRAELIKIIETERRIHESRARGEEVDKELENVISNSSFVLKRVGDEKFTPKAR